MVSKQRINWGHDPPPDLAIECDVTSFTNVDDYFPYQIGELWIIRQQAIAIYQLKNNRYIPMSESRFFPKFDLNVIYGSCLRDAYQIGSEAIDKLSDRYPSQPK